MGRGIFLDHATGFVMGETAAIDDDVSILHGVTLGGTGKENEDRHPKIGACVDTGHYLRSDEDPVEVIETVTSFEKKPCVSVPLPAARVDNVTKRAILDVSDDFLEVSLHVTSSISANRRASPCSLAHVLYV